MEKPSVQLLTSEEAKERLNKAVTQKYFERQYLGTWKVEQDEPRNISIGPTIWDPQDSSRGSRSYVSYRDHRRGLHRQLYNNKIVLEALSGE